jgi:hypothetical protein
MSYKKIYINVEKCNIHDDKNKLLDYLKLHDNLAKDEVAITTSIEMPYNATSF